MSELLAPVLSDPAPTSGPACADAWARALAREQIEALGRLAQTGLGVAAAIEQQTLAAAEGSQPIPADIGLSFSRIALAVRLTLALQSKLAKDLTDLDDTLERERTARAAKAAKARDEEAAAPHQDRQARASRIVRRMIKAEHGDKATVDRLSTDLWERLEDDDIYGDLTDRPIGEIVALICHDLGLAPDWDDLAREAWAREEIKSGVAGSPFAGLAEISAPPWLAAHAASP